MRTSGRSAAASWRGSLADGTADHAGADAVSLGCRGGTGPGGGLRSVPGPQEAVAAADLGAGSGLWPLPDLGAGVFHPGPRRWETALFRIGRHGTGRRALERLSQPAISAVLRGLPAGCRHRFGGDPLPLDKIFDFFTTTCKKILFNLAKMGYNTMENAVCADRSCIVQRRELVCASNARHF